MDESGSNPNPDGDRLSTSPSPSEKQKAERPLILIVEDNSADVFLILQAIKAAKIRAGLHAVKDGEQAIRFFDEVDGDSAAPAPALIILDINLPKKRGSEVLRHMRKSRRCGNTLVIAVSTSESARDRKEMTKLGANCYFHKPSEYAEFMKLGVMIQELLSGGSGTA